MRRFPDGTIWLPKSNPKLEQEYDRKYDRVPGELKWTLKGEDQGLKNWRELHRTAGSCYIVGKGPSLDKLNESYFIEGKPIFCMNEAVHTIEELILDNPIYCVQQDWNLKGACIPKAATHFCSRSAYTAANNPNAKMYNPKMLGATGNSLSADIAMRIAHLMGIQIVYMYAFDACINKNTGYAKKIGYLPDIAGNPNRFLGHRVILERTATQLKLDLHFLPVE